MFLHHSPFWLKAFFPDYIWRIKSNEKIVYLTFDDGPIPDVTEFVLDQLERFGAYATFFCIGDNVRKHPKVYDQLRAQGHSVGNHTFNHMNGWKTPTDDYLKNISKCDVQLAYTTALFRPPYGRITRAQARKLVPHRKIVMWDVLSGDFSERIRSEVCLAKSIRYTRPGSIVLFHDSLKARTNLEYTLPRYLDHFSRQGYEFRSLPMQ
jgi:peptidoglycan-N-acetylglucosamine deacetylase